MYHPGLPHAGDQDTQGAKFWSIDMEGKVRAAASQVQLQAAAVDKPCRRQ
jgi:hypothetical protein